MTPPHVTRSTLLFRRPAGHTSGRSAVFSPLARRLVAALMVIATALALGAMNLTPAAAATPTAAQMAAAVVARINSERVGNGIHSLRPNVRLAGTAHLQNLTMARANVLSHQLVGEPAFGTRVSHYGYQWCAAAENIAWSSNISLAGATGMDFAMYHEVAPNNGHRVNLLNPNTADLGVDVLIDLPHHKIWLTEDFGTPA